MLKMIKYKQFKLNNIKTQHHILVTQGKEDSKFLAIGFMNKKGGVDFEYGCYRRWVLVYVLAGTGVYTDQNGQQHNLKPGDVFRRDPRTKHRLEITEDGNWKECYLTLYSAENGDDKIIPVLKFLGLMDDSLGVKHIGLKLPLIKTIYELGEKIKTGSDDLFDELQAEILCVSVKLWRSKQKDIVLSYHQKLAQQAKMILEADLDGRDNVENMLQVVPTSYSNLRRIFREEVGVTVNDFRIRCRLQRACEFLLAGDEQLSSIARSLGYHDQFSFSRQFKKYYGVSPSIYREQFKL